MSQAIPNCQYSDCRNIGIIATQYSECDKFSQLICTKQHQKDAVSLV